MSVPRFVVELRPPRKGERWLAVEGNVRSADSDYDEDERRWVIVDDWYAVHSDIGIRNASGPIADPVPADPARGGHRPTQPGVPMETPRNPGPAGTAAPAKEL